MKRFLYLAASLMLVASLGGCQKDLETEGISRLTYYPEITLAGASEVTINSGDAYVDPGVTVTENGQPVDYTTTVTSKYFGYSGTTVNSNVADVYLINYSATNKDGYTATQSRVVNVNPVTGDFVTSLEGWYSANVSRGPSQGPVPANKDLNYILVSKINATTYGISCGIGGYYAIGRNYGDNYLATVATFTADIAGGVYTPGPNYSVGAFGGVAEMSNISVDAATKHITFTSTWDAGYVFTVTLKQVVL